MKSTNFFSIISPLLPTLLTLLFSLLFSTWLMIHTFSYDGEKHIIRVGTRLWSDFAAHIPLIRSFSMGDNLTGILNGKFPEYPLFPGEPIRYHFIFFMVVGILERMGLRLDWALNIPSILGFMLIMTTIYLFASHVFSDKRVGVLSLLFFIFNGSLSFLRFFQKHPLSQNTLSDILSANDFPSFAPWGPGDITAFWNLNIYTNQRHLAFAFGLALLFIYTLGVLNDKPYKSQLLPAVLWGIVIGLFPFFHQPTLLIFGIFGVAYFLLFPKLRLLLLVTGGIAAIFIVLQYPLITRNGNSISFYPFYLARDFVISKQTIIGKGIRLAEYWFQNLGGHALLIPFGFLIVPKRVKKVFLPIALLFLIPNLFKFSVDVAANHKFFNFFLILGNMLSASALIRFFDWLRNIRPRLTVILSYCLTVILIFFLTLSGLIDFFVVANDPLGTLADIPTNPVAAWVKEHTPKDANFLNAGFLYNPASLAGRKVLLGWPYFAWSAGYDTETRIKEQKILLEATNPLEFCQLAQKHNISYIIAESPPDPAFTINFKMFDKFFPKLFDQHYGTQQYFIYSSIPICSQ